MENSLVSILVITYNSSKFVSETLESAKNQSYNNIELIISDDCSTDRTLKICQDWLEVNQEHFRNSTIVQTPKNKGISGNCNYGLKFCKGKWVKLIAGDDELLENCIKDYVDFSENKNFKFTFSLPRIIIPDVEKKVIIEKQQKYNDQSIFFDLNAKEQHHFMIINGLPMSASTFFFNNSELNNLGGFDESFMQEDRPLYMKLTKLGYRLGYINKQLVKYRIHPENTSTKKSKNTPVNEFWFEKVHMVVKKYLDISLVASAPLVFFEYYNRYFVNKLTLLIGNNYKTYRVLRKFRYLSPLYFKKHFLKQK